MPAAGAVNSHFGVRGFASCSCKPARAQSHWYVSLNEDLLPGGKRMGSFEQNSPLLGT